MSVTGLSASSLYSAAGNQTSFQQIQQDFQQLGQDLQTGNLSQAQQDYATLTAALPSNQQQNSNNPIAQAFTQLGQALQSGDLNTAQQAFATIQQDFQQNEGAQGHHHHHAHGNQGAENSGQDSTIGQALSALGQALQNGDVNSAQQAFSNLTQILNEQFGTYLSNGSSASTASSATGSTLNVSA